MALTLLAVAMLEIFATGCRRSTAAKVDDTPSDGPVRRDESAAQRTPPSPPPPPGRPPAPAGAGPAVTVQPAPTANSASQRMGRGVCFPTTPVDGPGVVDPFHTPTAAAAQLNADGKVLYRQGRWDEARRNYRAAETADPQFLAPALNVACSFVRQERFAEALSEVLRLVDRAYLPWSDDVATAADLGALKVHAEGKKLRIALDEGRLRWAAGLVDDLVFVARTRAPLKVGDATQAAGALVLAPRQEVFAWSPRTLRYRQLTSEEGRVLALARSPDGRRVAYVTAEKLVRGVDGDVSLRGVAVEELDLTTLSPLGRGVIEGDVSRLEIVAIGVGFGYRAHRSSGVTAYRFSTGLLEPGAVPRAARIVVALTGKGVAPPAAAIPLPGDCRATARQVTGPASVPAVNVQPSPRVSAPPIKLGGPFGAGLAGLPLL